MIILRLLPPLVVSLLLFLPTWLYAQSPVLVLPVEGMLNRDFYIVNYVDQDTTVDFVLDYNCGYQTYDGHEGTDFVLRSFRQMDSGVAALAAAPGRVFAVVDTAFDRNTTIDVTRGFGNYIGVVHPGGYYSYYAHIRKGSALVQVGDSVVAGEPIALVGSSGNSTDPHLHFELYRDSTLIDPFGGPCSGTGSLWADQPAYDTSYHLVDHGLFSWTTPDDVTATVDTIRERPPSRNLFDAGDTTVTFWSHVVGVYAGDTSYARWFDSTGEVWFSFDYVNTYDAPYFFFWTYINVPPAGRWSMSWSIHDIVVERSFIVAGPASHVDYEGSGSKITASARNVPDGILVLLTSQPGTSQRVDLELYDIQGRLQTEQSIELRGVQSATIPLEPGGGTYFLVVRSPAGGIILPIARLQ